ncbi:gamma-glutamyltransferase [Castellaniella sp.]|uniref:gamma-glutamyltransferase n=1 Tax=Castellaniella sp. TaxID=1955812 RepID=UPI0035669B03
MLNPIARSALLALLLSGACAWPPAIAAQAGPALAVTAAEAQTQAVAVTATAVTRAAAAAYDDGYDIFHPVVASHAMVASESAPATQVGLQILQAGGNAVDAAVATAFALAVVQPWAGNLGGGGFMVVHDAAGGQNHAVDFRETAPLAAGPATYVDAQGQVIPGRSLHGPLAAGVPGTVAGLALAHRQWGSLPWARLIEPAIQWAEQGMVVSPTLADALQRNRDTMGPWPATRAIFWRAGQPLRAGERLVQADLAQSLRWLAQQGAAAFYEGPIAERLVAEMQRTGGLIDAHDLAAYRARLRAPLEGHYRGKRVVTMPPPSSGGVHLLQLLHMLEPLPLDQWGVGSARTIHVMAEAMKLAYADRARYLGDPDFVQVPVAGLVSRAYARERAALIDPGHARPLADWQAGDPWPHESEQTTHFSVVDAQGNAVALTYTLNTGFGNGQVIPGTGILLNNEMDDFALQPGVPNVYGLVGSQANAVAGGKRPLSSMTPTIVLDEHDQVWLVTGTPGGARIITTVLQALVDAIDFGLNPAEAAAQPRFHHQGQPDELRVEKGFSPDTLALLRARGHSVVVRPTMGKTQTIQRHDGQWYGASDPRNPDGLTLGY